MIKLLILPFIEKFLGEVFFNFIVWLPIFISREEPSVKNTNLVGICLLKPKTDKA